MSLIIDTLQEMADEALEVARYAAMCDDPDKGLVIGEASALFRAYVAALVVDGQMTREQGDRSWLMIFHVATRSWTTGAYMVEERKRTMDLLAVAQLKHENRLN